MSKLIFILAFTLAILAVSQTASPTVKPTASPTVKPTARPTVRPTARPTASPTVRPTARPTTTPTMKPSFKPTHQPTSHPTSRPTAHPTAHPTSHPTAHPTAHPTSHPTAHLNSHPTSLRPSSQPTAYYSTPYPKSSTENLLSDGQVTGIVVMGVLVVVGLLIFAYYSKTRKAAQVTGSSVEPPPPTAPPLSEPQHFLSPEKSINGVPGAVEFKTAEEDDALQSETLRVADAVEGILLGNFDVVSRAAVIVLTKYLVNVLLHSHPTIDTKYHVIKLDNKVVKEKILPAQSALSVLVSVGFRETEKGVLQITPDLDNLERVEEAVTLLRRAMDDLDIREEDRPVIPALPIVMTSSPPVIDFNPFKTIVIRPQGLPDPISASKSQPSNIEVQVEQLKKMRAELEGNPSEIIRNTRVFLPRLSEEVNVVSDTKDNQEDFTDVSNDAAIILKSLKKEEDGRPLTTSALREMRQLTNGKVYNETVVRVRFPDKVEIVAHFHPRNTLKEVYFWLLDQLSPHLLELVEELQCEEVEKRKVLQAMDLFELFISPPRTSLLPAKIKTAVGGHSRSRKIFVQWNDSDLVSLGLVPAVLVSLTWKKPFPLSLGQGHEQALGFYLKEDLLTSAVASSVARVSLPQGRNLTTKKIFI